MKRAKIVTNLEEHIKWLKQIHEIRSNHILSGWEVEWRELNDIDHSFTKNDFATSNKYLELNRYTDVLANEPSRVKLLHCSDHDYINANFIPASHFPNAKTNYIATQGPKSNTIDHFWHMIYQQNVILIVMLAQVEESGRPKCAKYWPSLNSTLKVKHGKDELLEITTMSQTVVPNTSNHIIHSQFKLKVNNTEVRTVHHLQYIGWPDHGVPSTTDNFTKLCELCGDLRQDCDQSAPVVVHCSAGIGRTGSLMTVSIITEQMRHHKQSNTTEPFEFDVLGTVKKLKQLRKGCVQTMQQYQFCYNTILAEAKVLGLTKSSRGPCILE